MSICDSPTEIEIENAILNIVDSEFWTEILKTHWGIQYCYKNIKDIIILLQRVFHRIDQ